MSDDDIERSLMRFLYGFLIIVALLIILAAVRDERRKNKKEVIVPTQGVLCDKDTLASNNHYIGSDEYRDNSHYSQRRKPTINIVKQDTGELLSIVVTSPVYFELRNPSVVS